jgi:hypothetical protein
VFPLIKLMRQAIGRETHGEKCMAQKYQKWYVIISNLDRQILFFP